MLRNVLCAGMLFHVEPKLTDMLARNVVLALSY